jgi:hypothetical protein
MNSSPNLSEVLGALDERVPLHQISVSTSSSVLDFLLQRDVSDYSVFQSSAPAATPARHSLTYAPIDTPTSIHASPSFSFAHQVTDMSFSPAPYLSALSMPPPLHPTPYVSSLAYERVEGDILAVAGNNGVSIISAGTDGLVPLTPLSNPLRPLGTSGGADRRQEQYVTGMGYQPSMCKRSPNIPKTQNSTSVHISLPRVRVSSIAWYDQSLAMATLYDGSCSIIDVGKSTHFTFRLCSSFFVFIPLVMFFSPPPFLYIDNAAVVSQIKMPAPIIHASISPLSSATPLLLCAGTDVRVVDLREPDAVQVYAGSGGRRAKSTFFYDRSFFVLNLK